MGKFEFFGDRMTRLGCNMYDTATQGKGTGKPPPKKKQSETVVKKEEEPKGATKWKDKWKLGKDKANVANAFGAGKNAGESGDDEEEEEDESPATPVRYYDVSPNNNQLRPRDDSDDSDDDERMRSRRESDSFIPSSDRLVRADLNLLSHLISRNNPSNDLNDFRLKLFESFDGDADVVLDIPEDGGPVVDEATGSGKVGGSGVGEERRKKGQRELVVDANQRSPMEEISKLMEEFTVEVGESSRDELFDLIDFKF